MDLSWWSIDLCDVFDLSLHNFHMADDLIFFAQKTPEYTDKRLN